MNEENAQVHFCWLDYKKKMCKTLIVAYDTKTKDK